MVGMVLFLYSCKEMTHDQSITEPSKTNEDWIVLFDGSSLQGWRGFNRDTLPSSWMIEDGCLKTLGT